MMGTARSVVVALLLLLTAGCARARPDTPVSEPQTVATRPAAPKAAAAGAPASQPGGLPRAKVPRGPAPVARAPAAAPPLDLKALTQQLRETKAIGIFTKITLKNQVDDLLDGFREYYQGKAKLGDDGPPPVLRPLDDEGAVAAAGRGPDARVSHRVVARGDLGLLADPKKFASLDA